MYKHFFKRVVDVVLAGTAIVILSPVLLLSWILIKIDSRGPYLFMQERLGYKGSIFSVYKIRTMTHKKREVTIEITKDNAEVTTVGKVFRRFKIDELLQLFNILKGDMSIVGPRPGMPKQIFELDEEGKKRLLVRPGLTGLAQINGGICLSWPERWKWDCIYVDKLSFWLDVKIMFKTVIIVFLGEDKFVKKPDEWIGMNNQ